MSERMVYARHGHELMGCKSPVLESSHCREDRVKQVLAEGKGVSARRGLEEAGAQSYEPTNRNSIQGRHPDKSAQHDEVHGFRRNGKCCGCVATVHVLIRGDLSGFAVPDVWDCALYGNMPGIGQKSAKAIVGVGRRPLAIGRLETSRVSPEALPRRRAERRIGEEPQ